jgi:hypothetical protein
MWLSLHPLTKPMLVIDESHNLFKKKKHFGDWILRPSSSKKPDQLGLVSRASPCL